jgi:hypothetical protein
MGGGGLKQTGTTSAQQNYDPSQSALMQGVLPDLLNAYGNLGGVSAFAKPMPSAVQPLNGDQGGTLKRMVEREHDPLQNPETAGAVQAYQAMLNGGAGATADERRYMSMTPEERASYGANVARPTTAEQTAEQAYTSTVNAPVGSSPATLAAQQAMEAQYNAFDLPTLQAQMSLSGLGRSGALGDALTKSRIPMDQAKTGLLQEEMRNRMAAASGLSVLGGQEGARTLTQGQMRSALASGAAGRGAGLASGAAGRDTQARLGAAAAMASTGQYEDTLQAQRAQQAFDAAEIMRQMQQAPLEEAQQDFLRRQGIAQGIAAPIQGLGPTSTSTITRAVAPSPLSGIMSGLNVKAGK